VICVGIEIVRRADVRLDQSVEDGFKIFELAVRKGVDSDFALENSEQYYVTDASFNDLRETSTSSPTKLG